MQGEGVGKKKIFLVILNVKKVKTPNHHYNDFYNQKSLYFTGFYTI